MEEPQQPKTEMKIRYHSFFILVVILCCLAGAFYAFKSVNSNMRAITEAPEYIVVVDSLRGTENTHDTLRVNILNPLAVEDTTLVAAEVAAADSSGQVRRLDVARTTYHTNKPFLVWTVLIIIMVSIAAGAFPVFVHQVFHLKSSFGLKWINLGLAGGLAGGFLLLVMKFGTNDGGLYIPHEFITDMKVLLKDGSTLQNVVVITFILQAPIFITIALLGASADRITATKEDKASVDLAIRKFQQLESTLRKCLQVVAILVVFSILTSLTLGKSLRAVIEIPGFDIFPEEIGYIYGLIFTFFLAMVYIPTHYYLRFKGRTFVENLKTGSNKEDKEEQSWLKEVKESILIKKTAIESLKIALTVTAPLITSLIPEGLNLMG